MKFSKNKLGMSLIEILVVIGIFSVLGVITTRAIVLTVAGGRKSESVIRVRENLSYSMGVMERLLRNANSITDTCPNTNTLVINYLDQDGSATKFSCGNIGAAIGFVASGSANLKLTSDTVDIVSCSFLCSTSTTGPSSVKIFLEAQDATATGADSAIVESSKEVFLRNY